MIEKHTVFGEYITLGNSRRDRTGKTVYEVMCTCGKINWIQKGNLLGNTLGCYSCGNKHRNVTHGKYYTPEHTIWASMLSRCNNSNNTCFNNYGGRGIRVCEEWGSSFEKFYGDMGPRPSKKHSIDRIDNNKGYSKENCRWATNEEQCNNKRTSLLIRFKGETLSITQWSRKCKLARRTISKRLSAGWSVDKALSTPVLRRGSC